MAGKLDFDPGQAAMGHQLTISEILAEYLRMERGRLAPKTHARYNEVIVLFTQSLNGYAANSLSQFDRARFDKLFDAEGEQHREFCDMFGPEKRCSAISASVMSGVASTRARISAAWRSIRAERWSPPCTRASQAPVLRQSFTSSIAVDGATPNRAAAPRQLMP